MIIVHPSVKPQVQPPMIKWFITCCDDCGKRFEEDEEHIETTGNPVCQACADNHYVNCDSCSELVHTNDVQDGQCEDCYNEDHFSCNDCGNSYHNDDRYSCDQSDYDYCQDCFNERFSTCERCDEYCRNDDIRSVGDSYWCSYCYEEYSCTCEECNESYDMDDLLTDEDSGRSLCTYCYNDKHTVPKGIVHPSLLLKK